MKIVSERKMPAVMNAEAALINTNDALINTTEF
jgi:hypothetical protein